MVQWLTDQNFINVIHHDSGLKKKTFITSVDTEKAFHKFYTYLMRKQKKLRKLGANMMSLT